MKHSYCIQSYSNKIAIIIAGHMSCTEDSVTVVSDVYSSSLQLVEMCSSERVWSPVCDYNWTPQDATVVCREVGYTSLGKAKKTNKAQCSYTAIPC